MNTIKTGMLLAFLTALFMGVGYLIGGTSGMVIAFVVAAGINLFSYWNSDKIVLRMHHAREVDASAAPELHRMVQKLAAQARSRALEPPKTLLAPPGVPGGSSLLSRRSSRRGDYRRTAA